MKGSGLEDGVRRDVSAGDSSGRGGPGAGGDEEDVAIGQRRGEESWKDDMLCSVCQKNEAKVHLTQIVDDKMQKVDLCEECSKAKGVTDPKGFSLADLLLGLGTPQEAEARSAGKPGEAVCPGCGLGQSDFKKTGRFGCPQCYSTFAEGLTGMLKTLHKGLRHIGKVPSAQRPKREPDLLKQLNRRLEKAVAAENFEEAALIRDQIRALKQAAGTSP